MSPIRSSRPFHQTLKRWLSSKPRATTIAALDAQLAEFARVYNTERPRRALARRTPHETYTALPKDAPRSVAGEEHWRVRFDTVDKTGCVSFRYAGALRHLGIGRAHARARILLLADGPDTLVIARDTGEILAEHTIDPTRDYQPQKPRIPLPKKGDRVNDDPRHL